MNINTDNLAVAMESAHEPYSFEATAYKNCFDDPHQCMDRRHIFTLFDVLCAGEFRSALELGCYKGASTTAFVEALNLGAIKAATFCDVEPNYSSANVVMNTKRGEVILTHDVSSRVLASNISVYDFIFVDASHDLESVEAELAHILRRLPRCIMAHDTNATEMGLPKCEGAKHLRDVIRKHPLYRGKCIEDTTVRDGEATYRGLFFATSDQELYEKARDIFDRRCPILEETT